MTLEFIGWLMIALVVLVVVAVYRQEKEDARRDS